MAGCSPRRISRWGSPAWAGGSPPSCRPKTPPGSPRCSAGPSAASRTPRTKKSQAVWLCGEVSAAVEQALGADSPLSGQGPRQIEQLATRGQVVRWLEQLLNELLSQLEQYSLGRSALVEKARQYVCDNVEKRIMLQDVAEYVCISPGYLSSLFKKQYSQNLVDYINEVKMERACELIREGRYRIYEISYRMGFENAYYFSRVFKRHIGMTPSEYRKSLGREEPYVE